LQKAAAAATTASSAIIDDIASCEESDDMAVEVVKTEPVDLHSISNNSSNSSSSSSSAVQVDNITQSLWNTLVSVLQVTPQQEQLLASKVAIAQVIYMQCSSFQNCHASSLMLLLWQIVSCSL
jgi:hypothetical protein